MTAAGAASGGTRGEDREAGTEYGSFWIAVDLGIPGLRYPEGVTVSLAAGQPSTGSLEGQIEGQEAELV